MKMIRKLAGVSLFLNFFISSIQTCHCAPTQPVETKSSDGKLEVTYKLGGESSKTVGDAVTKGFLRALEKVTTNRATDVFDNVSESPLRFFAVQYAATLGFMRRYAQFGGRTKVVRHETVERLKNLLHKVLVHAQENECDCDDYVVIAERVQKISRYAHRILQDAYNECMPTKKWERSRSLLQRFVGLVTTPYDVRSIARIIEWVIADLEELEQRSAYTKGFDVDHYKKVICYLQADLDTLFDHLEELV